uniref:Uncharacterized protein n=1 Tax=viral metagenome TaxID=1070528 RepID=A0A6M3ILV2_9ZZZZ
MADISKFDGVTKLDLSADRVIQGAIGKLDWVVVIGYDKDGDEYFAGSHADGGDVLWLIERMKLQLLLDED